MKSMTAEQRNHMLLCDPVSSVIPKMAVPTIISQLIVLIYNLADTWFIGQTDDPYMVAAAALYSPQSFVTVVCTQPPVLLGFWSP